MVALGKAAMFFMLGKACDFVLKKKGNAVLEVVRLKTLSMSGRAAAWLMRKRAESGKTSPSATGAEQKPVNADTQGSWWWHADLTDKCIRPACVAVPSEQRFLFGAFRRPHWLRAASFTALDGSIVDPKYVFERPEDAARFLASRF